MIFGRLFNFKTIAFAGLLVSLLMLAAPAFADCSALPNGLVAFPRFDSSGSGTIFTESTATATAIVEGTIAYDTSGSAVKFCDGANWQDMGSGGGGGSGTPVIDQFAAQGTTIDPVTITATSNKWPDYIVCENGGATASFLLSLGSYSPGASNDEVVYSNNEYANYWYIFDADGTFDSKSGAVAANCASANDIDSICDDNRCGFFGGGGGGGASALSGLTDVDTTGVADGNCLVYNNGTSKWEDGSCGGAETDPQVGTLTASKWCAANAGGTAIDCTQDPPSGGGSVDIQTFTSSGTWTKPGSGSMTRIQCWGGGGGGGRYGSGTYGGGGGGGGYNEIWIPTATLGATETVTIGSGGAGRAGSDGQGGAGGTTTFGAVLAAYGASGGYTNGGGGGGPLGAGGQTTSNAGGAPIIKVYTTHLGDGSNGSGGGGGGIFHGGGGEIYNGEGLGSIYGGAGGGGYNGLGGKSVYGGNGGAGSSTGTAQAGTQPGGGGGGTKSGTGGAGAAGQCVATTF